MKRRKTYGSMTALLFLTGLIFLIQSCDITSSEESFENPYTLKTQQTFDNISEAVFKNVAENIKDKAPGTIFRDDIMRYANEGYLKWATNNGAKIGAFEAGANFSQKFRRFQMRSGSSSSKKATLTLDSLLTESGLSNTQKNYILELPEIVAESKNIAHLERELNAFDKKVYKELGEEDSKPVLRMSAIMHSSMDFITTNAKLLGTLAELVEENNRKQSYFYRPSLRNDKKNLFQFAQSQDGPTDPPDWGDFYNGHDMASATLGGAFTGAGSVGPAGAGVGSYFGPWGTAIGGVIGGFVGGIGGGINGTLEYQSQLKEYGDE